MVALKITQRREDEVPGGGAAGKANENLLALKNEMSKLGAGMVLEIETENERAVRGTKMLVTRAANQLGTSWKHWSVGSKVFARPSETTRRRGRPKQS